MKMGVYPTQMCRVDQLLYGCDSLLYDYSLVSIVVVKSLNFLLGHHMLEFPFSLE